MPVTCTVTTPAPVADIQATFVRVLPRIEAHARYALRREGRDVRAWLAELAAHSRPQHGLIPRHHVW